MMPALKKAIDKGMIVAISSQTLYGRTHPLVYTNLRKLSLELGCIFTEDMIPETALVKLAWVLGHKLKGKNEVEKMMLENFAGEISNRHDDTFLY